MLIHWLRRESKGRGVLWGVVQVREETLDQLGIYWRTLKTDKGKKNGCGERQDKALMIIAVISKTPMG